MSPRVDHKKPTIAFLLVLVVTAAIVGSRMRADALPGLIGGDGVVAIGASMAPGTVLVALGPDALGPVRSAEVSDDSGDTTAAPVRDRTTARAGERSSGPSRGLDRSAQARRDAEHELAHRGRDRFAGSADGRHRDAPSGRLKAPRGLVERALGAARQAEGAVPNRWARHARATERIEQAVERAVSRVGHPHRHIRDRLVALAGQRGPHDKHHRRADGRHRPPGKAWSHRPDAFRRGAAAFRLR